MPKFASHASGAMPEFAGQEVADPEIDPKRGALCSNLLGHGRLIRRLFCLRLQGKRPLWGLGAYSPSGKQWF